MDEDNKNIAFILPLGFRNDSEISSVESKKELIPRIQYQRITATIIPENDEGIKYVTISTKDYVSSTARNKFASFFN